MFLLPWFLFLPVVIKPEIKLVILIPKKSVKINIIKFVTREDKE